MNSNRFFSSAKLPKHQEHIFIMGGPGSGKGTQSEILKNKYDYCHISTGHLIRNILQKEGENTQKTKLMSEMKQGVIFDATMIVNLVKEEIAKHPKAKGFLIDGCPRSMEQLELFEKEVNVCDKIVYLEVSDEIMEERMLGRKKIENREDDNSDIIKNRINSFHKKTMLVIKHLEESYPHIFYKINGNQEISHVEKMIQQVFDKDITTKCAI